jgi:hypothetical protein
MRGLPENGGPRVFVQARTQRGAAVTPPKGPHSAPSPAGSRPDSGPSTVFFRHRELAGLDVSPTIRPRAVKLGKVRNLHKAHSFTGKPLPAYVLTSFRPRTLAGHWNSAR